MSFFGRAKMAEAPKVEMVPFEEGFPPPTIPTIYCDGIANLAPSAHVIKFYLFRTDPDQTAKPKYKNQVLAQIIMPISAFIYSGLFFEKSLKQFVELGIIPKGTVDNIKQSMQTEQQK
jgi:hypothetical protein